jgi:hypothetical protein
MSELDVGQTQQAADSLSGYALLIFGIRTLVLIAGVYLIWRGLVLLWELRPIRRKKYTTVVDAEVTELNEEHHSASMNVYFMPRFEYEQSGETKAFSPSKSYRPCRLKLGGRVTLCIAESGKFRTIRKNISVKKALLILVIGIALAVSQIFF